MQIRIIYFMVLFFAFTNCSRKHSKQKSGQSSSINNLSDLTSQIKISDTIYIQEGHYQVEEAIWNDILDHDITIIGLGKVTIECSTQFAYFKAPTIVKNYSIKRIIDRKSKQIPVKISSLKTSDISETNAFILSDGIIEKAWKYKKGELLNISKFHNGNIVFKGDTFFDYNPNQNVNLTIYAPTKIVFKNITFQFNKNVKWDGNMPIRIDGCKVELENIKAKNFNGKDEGWFMGMYFCSDINIENVEMENFLYGLVINYSKEVKAKNILAHNVNHAIVPATFTKNVFVDGFRGQNTSPDAHLAINVHYNNVDVDSGDGLFNCRAFGVKMTNCKITSSENGEKPVTYLGVGSLTEEYKFLYKEYDVLLDNVEWLHHAKWFNGLHVDYCRNFVVNNCKTHSVTTGNFLNSFEVTNSKIGYLKSYDTNFKVSNTTFDAKLQGVKEIISPLSCSWSGMAEIDKCKFYGFKDTYLFGYVHSPESNINIKNTNFGKLKGFVKKYGYKQRAYKFINFEGCTFDNIEEVPKQLTTQKNQIISRNTFKK